jgi:dihydrofolate reductase
MLSIVVAYDQKLGIGIKNKLPWKLSEDLKNFRKLTEYNYVVMGRKTYESIGYPLKNRKNIIMTRDKNFRQDKCTIFSSIVEVVNLEKKNPLQQVFIIGGAEIYQLFLPYADRLYVTLVKTMIQADAFFPKWDHCSFKCIRKNSYSINQGNEFNFDLEIWEKRR